MTSTRQVSRVYTRTQCAQMQCVYNIRDLFILSLSLSFPLSVCHTMKQAARGGCAVNGAKWRPAGELSCRD